MKNKNLKFNKLVVLSILIFAFFISLLNKTTIAIAETRSTNKESTNPTHPVGHKIEGAKYWDYHEEYDKFDVITGEPGGRGGGGGGGNGGTGSGSGAGSGSGSGVGNGNGTGSGSGAGSKGNGGVGNSQGGVGGGLAGSNIGGTGVGQSGTGSGSGAVGGSNNAGSGGGAGAGNNEAISAMNSLRQAINESREESYAKILETAKDRNSAMESILARERMLESIEREMAKESIKAMFYDETFSKNDETPTEASKVFTENSGPPQEEESTTARNEFKWFVDFSELFKEQETTTRETKPLDKPTLEPVAQNSNLYSNDQIMPSEADFSFYEFTDADNQIETRQNAQYVRPLEPQDFIEQTERNNQNNKKETFETVEPTAINNNEQQQKEEIQSEANKTEEQQVEVKEIEETTIEEGSGKEQEKEDLGAEGGKDRNKEADLAGLDNKNDSNDQGGGGGGQGNSDGQKRGLKIIEIDAIGGIGVGESAKSIDFMKLIINLILILCFLLGIVFHFADIQYRNEIKKGYF